MIAEVRRLLFADDDPNDVELTLRVLADHNLANEVDVVGDGEQVLQYLRKEGPYARRVGGNPALLLLDLKMPKLDGLDVLKVIKQDERLRTIPVVMLTSSREERDLVHSYQLGVNAYVVKPVAFADFVEAVRQIGIFWAVINQAPPVTMEGGAYGR